MDNFTFALMLMAIASVAVVLALGLWNMLRGGDAKRAQALMRWRVFLQFIAVILVMATIYLVSKG
jgi:hypothetical protein